MWGGSQRGYSLLIAGLLPLKTEIQVGARVRSLVWSGKLTPLPGPQGDETTPSQGGGVDSLESPMSLRNLSPSGLSDSGEPQVIVSFAVAEGSPIRLVLRLTIRTSPPSP